MTTIRVLHVDDEPDIREVVAMSLDLDPDFAVRSCASGAEGLVAAAEYLPDLILLDVMMPAMDGPAMLTHLRENPKTAEVPVVFMTAAAQKGNIAHFKSLGAVGVIVKPFDPLTLAKLLRGQLHVAKLDTLGDYFLERLRSSSITLSQYRLSLSRDPKSSVTLEELQSHVHKLAGAAGVFGFPTVSLEASLLEESIIDKSTGRGKPGAIEAHLDSLLVCLECEQSQRSSTAASLLDLGSRKQHDFRQT